MKYSTNICCYFVVSFFLFLGCGGGAAIPVEKSVHLQSAAPDTTVGLGDVFDIRVYGEEGLSNEYRVASDGTIDFPFVGALSVEGKNPAEIKELIEEKLITGGFFKQPQISVFVKEYNSKKISVIGEVKKPGALSFRDGMTVVEAISEAGGFTSMAKENNTTVIRVVDGKKRKYKTPVKDIAQGKASNFILRAGDIIFVPERII